MNIIFVGDLNPHTRSSKRLRALQEIGHAVTGVSFVREGVTPGLSGKASLVRRVFHKAGYPLDDTGFNRRLPDMVDTSTELVWVDKGLPLRPGTLKKAVGKNPGIKRVLFSDDNLIVRHNQSAWLRKCLPVYDTVFTIRDYQRDEAIWRGYGVKNIRWVDRSYDVHSHRPMELSDEDRQKFGADVGFIGTFERPRAEHMLHLAKSGIRVRIFGNGWEAWAGRHPLLDIRNMPVYRDDYAKAICAARINLCFLRRSNGDMQTGRSFEIPACGAFLLAERSDAHLRLFEEGREAEFFDGDDPAELTAKVRRYLEHDEERQRIARAGRERCLRDGYSLHERLKWMLESLDGNKMPGQGTSFA